MIHLAVGRLEIDWGKNHGFNDYSDLYQGEIDVADVPYYYYGYEDGEDFEGQAKWKPLIELKEGLSKALPLVVDRMNLLGRTFDQCKMEFSFLADLHGFDERIFTFDLLCDLLATVDVSSISFEYGEGGEDFGKFFRREIVPRFGYDAQKSVPGDDFSGVSYAMECLSAYSIIQLLARNPQAVSLPVQWSFDDIEAGGYARRDDFVRALDARKRFLIVTEGSSDAAILRHALKLLRPHISDFFDFVDMEEGYPFSGTGNVFRFVQGLISISVQNKVLVLFDNDAEGVFNYRRCIGLNVPVNMRILRLPDLPEFREFQTIGPDGERISYINGRAAAIECYLDLDSAARIRWTTYNNAVGAYQGELDTKTRYMRSFIDQRQKKEFYNYSRLEAILDVLVAGAVSISELDVNREWERENKNDEG